MKRLFVKFKWWHMVPGLLTWLTVTSPIWLARPFPLAASFFLTFLVVFWVYRAVVHIYGLNKGVSIYETEMQTDWQGKVESLNFFELPNRQDLPTNKDDLRHIVLVPLVNEDKIVLDGLFRGVVNQTFPMGKILLVFSVEEKYHKKVTRDIYELSKKHSLEEVRVFVHPKGLAGEVQGAASNRTWGARSIVTEIALSSEPLSNFVITTMDGDAILDAQYISRLTYEYFVQEHRRGRFFQTAVYLLDNNIWDVPTLVRIQANAVTLGTLSTWIMEPYFKETFSNFSLSLQTLVAADYWDPSIPIDDTPLFWRIFLSRDGDFSGVPLFIPVSSDAVQGKDYWNSHVKQYKQLIRWSWGIITFPMAMTSLVEVRGITRIEKLLWVYRYFERYSLFYSVILLITFGFPLIVFSNPDFGYTSFGISLPNITSGLLTVALFMLLPGAWYRKRLTKPMPSEWGLLRRVLISLEGGLVILHLFIFVVMTNLQVETKYMLGGNIRSFWFTTKSRK